MEQQQKANRLTVRKSVKQQTALRLKTYVTGIKQHGALQLVKHNKTRQYLTKIFQLKHDKESK